MTFSNKARAVDLTQRFSANLRRLRENLEMSKSDLAKEIFGSELDKRGYTVARNRDRIGAWEAEKARPKPENIVKLASFFGIEPSVLAPDLVGKSAAREPETASFRVLASRPDFAHLKIDTVLPIAIAAQIVALVSSVGKAPDPEA